jgi:hypothetical protein
LPAEIVYAGERYHGFLIDVSADGGFIQMPRPVAVGEEVELWFADEQLRPQVARARIVRRRAVPTAAAAILRSGVGFEWTDPTQFARSLGSLAIEIEIEDPPEAEQPARALDEATLSAPAAHEPHASAPAAPLQANAELDPPGEIVPVEAALLVERTTELAPAAVRAEVVVIDEGELGAFEELARSLGARTLRLRWGAQADPVVWEAPPQLVVVSARVAIAVPLSDTMLGAGALGVAVCDSEANTLRARLRRQGYELVVQRAAHPATLRLLFASLLFRHRERRRERRRAFGAAVGLWRGFRRTHGTLLELSPSGGSLLLAREIPPSTRFTLRIPSKHTGGRVLALQAATVRNAVTSNGAVVGLRFEKMSERKRARLEALIRDLDSSGPVPFEAVPGQPVAAGAELRASERRQGQRVRAAHQALSLDPESGVARDVLFGTDLSLGGMRIEPHPRLTRGADLHVVLQPPGGAPPVTVRAEVARDDGERGLVLRFVSPPPAVQRALERMLDAAAEIERTQRTRSARDERVVLGTLVEAEAARA